MTFASFVLRLWWEPGWGLRASLRGVHDHQTRYFKGLEELNQYLSEQALRTKQAPEPAEALETEP